MLIKSKKPKVSADGVVKADAANHRLYFDESAPKGANVSAAEAAKLSGTKWNLTITPGSSYKTALEFRDKGVVVYLFDNRPSYGTWKPTGNIVIMRIGHLEFTGTITAGAIEGTCKIFLPDGSVGRKSDWKAAPQN